MFIAEQIAETIVGVRDLPTSTVDATRRCILDAVSAAVAGAQTPGANAARESAESIWGVGEVPVWFSNKRSSLIGAAFANSVSTAALDIDDGHRAAAGHPGAAIVPAVLAAVHQDPELAPRAVTAIAIGYEVGLRIAAARDLRTLDTVNSGRWSGQGAAAAVGWLRQLPARVIAESIATAGAVAPYMGFAEFTEVGNHVKEAIPFGAANGLASIRLAQAGFLSPLDVLDDARSFDPTVLTDGLGDSWMIETAYFKPYSCCRWIHASIDGLLQIMSAHRLTADDIVSIHIETFERAALGLNNQVAPKTLEAAQFSIPFCLGAIAVHGAGALIPMTDPTLLHDPRILAVAERTEVSLDPEMDTFFPGAVPSRVTVTTSTMSISETVMAPLGEPTNPLTWGALIAKFHALASRSLPTANQARLRAALDAMGMGNLLPLLAALAEPIGSASVGNGRSR